MSWLPILLGVAPAPQSTRRHHHTKPRKPEIIDRWGWLSRSLVVQWTARDVITCTTPAVPCRLRGEELAGIDAGFHMNQSFEQTHGSDQVALSAKHPGWRQSR